MILDCPLSRRFQDLVRDDVSYECHHTEIGIQFQESIDRDFPPHSSELKDGNLPLYGFLLDGVERATFPVGRTEYSDNVLAIISQCRQNVFAKCGLPYYSDSHIVCHL